MFDFSFNLFKVRCELHGFYYLLMFYIVIDWYFMFSSRYHGRLPPHHWPNLLEVDEGYSNECNHLFRKYSQSLSLINISYSIFLVCQSMQHSMENDGQGSTICAMPSLIKNLNNTVGTVHNKLLWKSLWNMDLILSKYLHSSIAYSS